MTRNRCSRIGLGVLILLWLVFGLFQYATPKQEAQKRTPKKEPYASSIQVGQVYHQKDNYLKLLDKSHYIRLRDLEWAENPDSEAEPKGRVYLYGVGTYTSAQNQIQLSPSTHWMQVFFHNKESLHQKAAEKIWEYMAFEVKHDTYGITVTGLPAVQLRLHKARWQIVEDPPGYLHSSEVKLPDSIEAARKQFTTKAYKRRE